MIVQVIKCPSCGAPQESKFVTLGEWNCEYCRDRLSYKEDEVKVIPTTTQNDNSNLGNGKDNENSVSAIPENPAFTTVSVLYLLSFLVACIALFFLSTNTVEQSFTFATNLYIAICGLGIGVSAEPSKESDISDPTMFAIILWLIYNIVLMFLGFPGAIVTRFGASIIYFVVGAIFGIIFAGDAIKIEVKKADKID